MQSLALFDLDDTLVDFLLMADAHHSRPMATTSASMSPVATPPGLRTIWLQPKRRPDSWSFVGPAPDVTVDSVAEAVEVLLAL
jgi:FMN phosphatase YigB (HAD superfamily)